MIENVSSSSSSSSSSCSSSFHHHHSTALRAVVHSHDPTITALRCALSIFAPKLPFRIIHPNLASSKNFNLRCPHSENHAFYGVSWALGAENHAFYDTSPIRGRSLAGCIRCGFYPYVCMHMHVFILTFFFYSNTIGTFEL